VTATASASGRTLRIRAARLGWVTAALAVFALALTAIAVWIVAVKGWDEQPVRTLRLPVNVEISRPAVIVLIAALVVAGAVFVALAGLETAAAMQVLSPERQLPAPLSRRERHVRQLILGPRAAGTLDVHSIPDWPATAVPGPSEMSPGTALRCTVLIPAHNEEAVLSPTGSS
jgi:hypothetical protein